MIAPGVFHADFFRGTFDEEAVSRPSAGMPGNIPVIFDDGFQAAQVEDADAGIDAPEKGQAFGNTCRKRPGRSATRDLEAIRDGKRYDDPGASR